MPDAPATSALLSLASGYGHFAVPAVALAAATAALAPGAAAHLTLAPGAGWEVKDDGESDA